MDDHEVGHRRAERHGVDERPVGDGVGAVLHLLGHDVGVGHGAGVEVIAREGDRPPERAVPHHGVDGERQFGAGAVAEPGDAGRQALEGHVVAGEADPVADDAVVGEQLQHLVVDLADVLRVAAERHPAERSDGPGEQRPQIGLGEDRDVEGVGDAAVAGVGADQVAVVEHLGAGRLELQHGGDVDGDGGAAFGHQAGRVGLAHGARLGKRAGVGHVAVDEVVGGGLVGDDVGDDAAPDYLRVDVGGIGDETDRQRPTLGLGGEHHVERRVEVGGDHVEIADRLALLGPLRIDVDAEDGGAGHAAGQRLRTAHAAKAGGQHEATGERAAESLLGDAHEDLVGALDDALAANILPGAGRQAAPANQALLLEVVEHLGLGPLADDVAVGHDDQRRLRVRLQKPDRLAGLDQQRLVLVHGLQRLDDPVVGGPVAGGAAERGVDDQVVGVFADRQHVFEEAQQRFLPPALGAERGAAGGGKAGIGHGRSSLRPTRRAHSGRCRCPSPFQPADRRWDRAPRTPGGSVSSARAARKWSSPLRAGRPTAARRWC